MVAASTVNAVIIQNSDIVNGNSNIEVTGGIWDGNYLNVTRTDGVTFCCILRWWQNVTNLKVHDSTVQNSKAWADGLAALNNFRFYNLTYIDNIANRTAADNFGGVNLEGTNSNGYIGNISGNTMDDLVAVVTDQATHTGSIYINCMAGYGPINNIFIENIQSTSLGVWHFVRLLDSVANPLSNCVVSGVTGSYIDAGFLVGSDSIAGNTSALNQIVIENVCINQFRFTASYATLAITGSYDSITIRSIKRTIPVTETQPKALIEQLTQTGGSVPAGRTLTISDAEIIHFYPNQGINLISITTGSVQNLTASDLRYNATLNGGAGVGNVFNLPATITANFIKLSRIHAINVSRVIAIDGITTNVVLSESNFSGPTSPANECVRLRGTIPNLALVGNNFNLANGGSGTALGIINFNGSSGTTVIRAHGNTFNNAANANVARVASEAIRFISPDTPVPSTLLTPARGDIILDSTKNNDPYRYSGSAWEPFSTGGAYTYNAPTTGFSLTIANGIERLVLDPAGTLATGTVTMPSTPADGEEVGISTTQVITALTVSGNTGQTMADTVTTLGVGGCVTFKWVSGQSKWYRVSN